MSFAEIARKYHLDPRTAKKYALSETKPVYKLSQSNPFQPRKAFNDESLQEQSLEGKYSIVKEYVRGQKKDLEEKATVRFETMPGLQGQVDWAFFEDHIVLEAGNPKKLYCFIMSFIVA